MVRVAMLFFYVILLRFLFLAHILSNIKKKTYKNHVYHCTPLDRWFFWTSHNLLKSKYSKYEKRIINYRFGATLTFALNLINHITLAIYSILFLFTILPSKTDLWIYCWENVRILPAALFCIEIVIFACINYYENRRFHQKRMSR